ncbi:MAG: BMC domain-containing protein [Candidatus Rokubacteria bacterium]|nr:BMC domain-containing protein [Candidatus Rokubacteria bacterium]
MAHGSVGIIETVGFVSLAQAVDTMVKTARVRVLRYEKVGDAIVSVCVVGDIGAVRVAVDAGLRAAEALGEAKAAVIANPSPGLAALLNTE